MLPKGQTKEKGDNMPDLSPKKIYKVLMKIEEMADFFLNSENFAPHSLLTLVPPVAML